VTVNEERAQRAARTPAHAAVSASVAVDRERGVFLVTGATGNVGRHVVSGLLGEGAAVRAMQGRSTS
jgi:hypothetical protein